ncbi:4926_t:CDS:2 [Gigaspora margarita]|uniref:4926_t:CDS:1 n=1 Tax=Gigaspora margarita TaxID=4874 RepID=A0ABN7W0D4_GIGMA|nr:4926_t:CDS:2 [Gigaspora margarita]
MSTNPMSKDVSYLKNLALISLKTASQSCLDYIKDLSQCPECAMEIESIDYTCYFSTSESSSQDQAQNTSDPMQILPQMAQITSDQSYSVSASESNPESVDFFSSYYQIVKAKDDSKKTIQDVIRAYYNFG